MGNRCTTLRSAPVEPGFGPGPGFGCPAEPFGPLALTWRTAFTAMTGAVLADAETFRARLPYPVGHIRADETRELVAPHLVDALDVASRKNLSTGARPAGPRTG
ncbi:hypothetical protein [Streptomyces sp. SM13]|uniref:hypothetical protein n=1 Tax=Streptomyces sp. SM13 TaxID=1983803 RepID=UPI000CD50755